MFTTVPNDDRYVCDVCSPDCRENVRIHWPEHKHVSFRDSGIKIRTSLQGFHGNERDYCIFEDEKNSDMDIHQVVEQILSGVVTDMYISHILVHQGLILVTLVVKRNDLPDLTVKLSGQNVLYMRFR